MMTILPIVLTIFFLSCQTSSSEPYKGGYSDFDIPIQPEIRSVDFMRLEDKSGFFLINQEYRNLEHNIIEYRRYIGELESQLGIPPEGRFNG